MPKLNLLSRARLARCTPCCWRYSWPWRPLAACWPRTAWPHSWTPWGSRSLTVSSGKQLIQLSVSLCFSVHVFLCPCVSVFLHFRDHVPSVSLLTLDSRHQDTLEDTVATFTEPVYIQVFSPFNWYFQSFSDCPIICLLDLGEAIGCSTSTFYSYF